MLDALTEVKHHCDITLSVYAHVAIPLVTFFCWQFPLVFLFSCCTLYVDLLGILSPNLYAIGFDLCCVLLRAGQSWTLHAGSANLSRALFTEMLKSGTISRPHAEVLDTVERYYTHRMMACSSVWMAEEIYRAAQSMLGASTTKYFLAQHGLQVHIFPTCHWPRL